MPCCCFSEQSAQDSRFHRRGGGGLGANPSSLTSKLGPFPLPHGVGKGAPEESARERAAVFAGAATTAVRMGFSVSGGRT